VALLDIATFVLAAGLLAMMRVVEPAPEPRLGHVLAGITDGARHLRDTLPLRQVTLASAAALLVIGFSETLTFEVAGSGLHRDPSFVGVLIAVQGVGAVIGAACAAALVRRIGEGDVAAVGMLVFSLGVTLLTSSSLTLVLPGIALFGFGIPLIVVALFTLLQRLTPGPLQGRTFSAVEVLVNTPQTVSIALGAVLVSLVDYHLLLVLEAAVVAAAGAWLLTRRDQRVTAPH
jgi:predicted MFS family arabinose efflux permease